MSLVKSTIEKVEQFEVAHPGRPYSKTCPPPPPPTQHHGASSSGGYGGGSHTCFKVIDSTAGLITVAYSC